MDHPIATAVARHIIEREFAPRRSRFRESLIHTLMAPPAGASVEREAVLARIHDQCTEELSERMRIAGAVLARACAGEPAESPAALAALIREEVAGYLDAEVADLVQDQRLISGLTQHLPKFLAHRTDS